jgi:hypothetical protein
MDSPPEIRIPISDRAAYLGRVHVGITIPLLALCLVPFSARLYTRVRPVMRCGWDDVFMVLGFVSGPRILDSTEDQEPNFEGARALLFPTGSCSSSRCI